jgi:hypothetical protein
MVVEEESLYLPPGQEPVFLNGSDDSEVTF